MKLVFEDMSRSYIDDILEIEKEAFTSPWSRESLEAELDNHLAIYELMFLEGQLIGYYGFWKVFEEGHIMNIAIKKEYRSKGLGKILFSRLIDRARENDIKEVSLEVRKSNLPARKLYDSYLFEIIGERKDYYAKGEDALVMRKYI